MGCKREFEFTFCGLLQTFKNSPNILGTLVPVVRKLASIVMSACSIRQDRAGIIVHLQ